MPLLSLADSFRLSKKPNSNVHPADILKIDTIRRKANETDHRSGDAETGFWEEVQNLEVVASGNTPSFSNYGRNTRLTLAEGVSLNQSVGSAHSPKSGGVIAGTTITQIITTTNEKPKEGHSPEVSTLPVSPEANSLDYSKIIFRKEKGGINKQVKTLKYTPVCEALANKRKSLQLT